MLGIRRLLIAAVVTQMILTHALAEEPVSISQQLIEQLDLSTRGLERVRQEAEAGRFDQAAELWRDWAVGRLRSTYHGPFGWHDYSLNAKMTKVAERLVGRIDEDEYLRKDPPPDWIDVYGMSGAPGTGQPIRWLDWPTETVARDRSQYGHFRFAIPLVAQYQQTGDVIYLQKWLEITTDFVTNQKRLVESIPPSQRQDLNSPWVKNHQACLHQGDRAQNLIKSLCILAKSLPDPNRATPTDWKLVTEPVAGEMPPEALRLIPAEQLATIVMSLVRDYPPLLLEFYGPPGVVPNQRLNGLMGLLMVSRQFSEFKGMADVERQTVAAITSHLNDTIFVDGGMFEQSFNYNLSEVEHFETLARIAGPEAPWSKLLHQRIEQIRRLFAGVRNPLGELPTVGNYSSNPPMLWADADRRERWFSAKPGAKDFERFGIEGTSLAFPYAGYYVMRRDRAWDSPYLFFMNARPGNGHHSMDANGIELIAYGRRMLAPGGPPFYTPTHLAPEHRANADLIRQYMDEVSSWKINTILVDGMSQARAGAARRTVYPDPVAARWHTSDRFDLVDGRYDLGYGWRWRTHDKPRDVEMDVSHDRRMIFLRDLNAWIALDTVRVTDGQTHRMTQVWKLPPWVEREKSPVVGFTDSQVHVRPDASQIATTDRNGPNLHLLQFGAGQRQYTKRFGESNPYFGWYASGIGDFVPAVDVHVEWTASTDSSLATVLWPTPTGAALPVTEAKDLSDDATTAFKLTTADGRTVELVYARGGAQKIQIGTVRVVAEMLLLVDAGTPTPRGIAIGCRELVIGGQPAPLQSADFEFSVDGQSPSDVKPITVPTTFSWIPGKTGIVQQLTADAPASP